LLSLNYNHILIVRLHAPHTVSKQTGKLLGDDQKVMKFMSRDTTRSEGTCGKETKSSEEENC